MKSKIEICYLCGKRLDKKEDISYDHVPPKQFYPSTIRKNTNLNLFTLPTHIACNKSYQKDEDYFVNSLGPLAKGSYSGNGFAKEITQSFLTGSPPSKFYPYTALVPTDNRKNAQIFPLDWAAISLIKELTKYYDDAVTGNLWKSGEYGYKFYHGYYSNKLGKDYVKPWDEK